MTDQGPLQQWPVRCPHCAEQLVVDYQDSRLRGLHCPTGHSFDAARQGYVNLLAGKAVKFTPDSAQMIMARERVQDSGIFSMVTAALSDSAASADPTLIVDCGAGTGHYLHQLLDAHPTSRGIAVDLSPAGLKRAAKHPRSLALAWDLWQPLPLADSSTDLLINVFAPRNPAEYRRVLTPKGRAVVVIPRPGHLHELRGSGLLGQQADKREQLIAQMAPHFGEPITIHIAASSPQVSPELAADLIFMGPAGHHRDSAELLRLVQQHPVSTISVDVELLTWQNQP